MGHRNLQQCVADLDRTGQLVRIESEIDPGLTHHTTSPEEMNALPEFYETAQALYRSLRVQANHS